MAERDSSDDEEATISSDVVVTKYKTAAEIANNVMAMVIGECVVGASVRTLSQRGDAMILADTGRVFKKDKEMKKGISFPTCLSVNQCLCCFSPLPSDTDVVLADGDMVKIELGTHIDGFCAQLAHTVVVGASAENKVTGRKADAMQACHLAAEVAHRLLKPGGTDDAVAGAVQKVAESFNCKPIEGTQSFQMERNEVCGEKTIVLNRGEAAAAARKVADKCEFGVNEVYAVDIAVTTGDGKTRVTDTRTTVHRRTEGQYSLKMKASRAFFSDVEKRFSNMPFSLASFEDERKARMGVVECVKHGLLEPYQVLYDKEGEFCAHFRFTLLLSAHGVDRITKSFFDPATVETAKQVDDPDLVALLATSTSVRSQKKKKKKAVAEATAGQ